MILQKFHKHLFCLVHVVIHSIWQYINPKNFQHFSSFCHRIMKITLLFIANLTFAFGGVPRDRYDPCVFFGICTTKATATMAPTSIAPSTMAPTTTVATTLASTTASPVLAKIKVELVSWKDLNLTFYSLSDPYETIAHRVIQITSVFPFLLKIVLLIWNFELSTYVKFLESVQVFSCLWISSLFEYLLFF